MRPKKTISKAAGLSHARTLMRRHLGWQRGFPLDKCRWCELLPGAAASTMALDNTLSRRTTRTIIKLRTRFPQALPHLVGDVDRWYEMQQVLLHIAKATIHDNVILPSSPLTQHPHVSKHLLQCVQDVRQQHPGLATLITACEWYAWTDLNEMQALFSWIMTNGTNLQMIMKLFGQDSRQLTIRLWQLVAIHGERRVQPVLEILACDIIWQRPLNCPKRFTQYGAKTLLDRDLGLLEMPSTDFASQLVAWVLKVGELDRKTQRRSLLVFDVLFQRDLLDPWAIWWQQLEEALAVRPRAINSGKFKLTKNTRAEAAATCVLHLEKTQPPRVLTEEVMKFLHSALTTQAAPLCQSLIKNMVQWPIVSNGNAIRMMFASMWMRNLKWMDRSDRKALIASITLSMQYIGQRMAQPKFMHPWKCFSSAWSPHYDYIDKYIVNELHNSAKMKSFFDIMSSDEEGLTYDRVELLVNIVAAMPHEEAKRAYAGIKSLNLEEDNLLESYKVKYAAELTVGEPQSFLTVLMALSLSDEYDWQMHKMALVILDRFQTSGLRSDFLTSISQGKFSVFKRTISQVATILGVGGEVPEIVVNDEPCLDWLENYPSTLHPELKRLARIDPLAMKTAAQTLRRDFPNRERMQSELAHLRGSTLLPSQIQRRITNLEKNLSYQPLPSQERLANLKHRLFVAKQRVMWQRWSDDIERTYKAAIIKLVDMSPPPEWINRPDVATALHHLASLSAETRSIAQKLLQQRCRPSPWELLSEPANAEFIAGLQRLGRDLGPWLHDGTFSAQIGNPKRSVIYGLERDPLEILQMGSHFNTCLSIGGCNFFSVFANIADINKQVLYIRNTDGKVCSRTLLALTKEGCVLPFHTYSHEGGEELHKLTQRFVHDLAARMGSFVVAKGSVQKLVVKTWYDDGPRDLTEQHPDLAEHSGFRKALAEVPLGQFSGMVETAFQPLGLNNLTVPWLLDLPEFAERPELMDDVLHFILRSHYDEAVISTILIHMGKYERCDLFPLLIKPVVHLATMQAHRGMTLLRQPLNSFLIQHAPECALRLLRQTRDRSVRCWSDEDKWRLAQVADSLYYLKRPAKAQELYQELLTREEDELYQNEYRLNLQHIVDYPEAEQQLPNTFY
jgi:hypothetical protein